MAQRLGVRLRQYFGQWKQRSPLHKTVDIVVGLFALAGMAIIGAWGGYQLGLANNRGAVDQNNRYLMSVGEMEGLKDKTLSAKEVQQQWVEQYTRLVAFAHYYPYNARLIAAAAQRSGDPMVIARMIAAAEVYVEDRSHIDQLADRIGQLMRSTGGDRNDTATLIPWMNTIEWEALRGAIIRDTALLNEAGRLTGVEPRMIAACLVGEQIRLFNSKREMFKRYLGPVKVLSVQSQFSFGVNGIKDFTASAVEAHLKDPASPFYMGKHYEHILDFETANHADERYKRLVDYRNHLYSYIYTGCILHQTMLQWKRAGYDISNRPDVLFTLFNVGFSQSEPKPNPQCGGSHITVEGRVYTFGAIGFDFYYSGELADALPFWNKRFIEDNGVHMTEEEIDAIQSNMSNCNRPSRFASSDSSNGTPAAATTPATDNTSGTQNNTTTL